MKYSCLTLKGQERIIYNVKDGSQVLKWMMSMSGLDGRYVGVIVVGCCCCSRSCCCCSSYCIVVVVLVRIVVAIV